MKPKKILFIITKSNLGGAQRYVFDLASSLDKDHYEVAVACGGNGLLVEKLKEVGIRVFPIKSFERDINLKKEWSSLFEIGRIIREYTPDTVHLNSSKAGGSGALVSRILGVKNIIFTAHGWPFYEDRSFFWKAIVWIFSYITTLLAHRVIVVSKHDRDEAVMPFQKKKIVHIPTALPRISFKARDEAREALFSEETILTHRDDVWLVSTGEHTKNKNLAMILEAMKGFTKKGESHIFLTLMSDGELQGGLKALAQRYGLGDQIHFTGFIPEARTYLKAFDIFLMPSLKEGFPYGLLEAGAAGVPVIASRVGGIPELVEDGKTGLLIDPRNPESFTDALSRLILSEETRTTFGNALQKKVDHEYTLSNMCAKTEELYSQEPRAPLTGNL